MAFELLYEFVPGMKGGEVRMAFNTSTGNQAMYDHRRNELFEVASVASAVEHVLFTNAIAGGGAKISAKTSATNAKLLLEGVGSSEVRINSRTTTQTSGNFIGFQSKPGQGAASTGNVIGCEISPRVNDTFALTGSGSVIGAHMDAYLKGTTGNIAGDVRGAQIELVTDDAGTRTVTGDVIGLRFRAAFSGTITGDMVVIRIEKAEAQTNSKQWEYVMELTGANALIWKDDYGTEVTTLSGAIKVRVNDADRWIPLYSGAPVE